MPPCWRRYEQQFAVFVTTQAGIVAHLDSVAGGAEIQNQKSKIQNPTADGVNRLTGPIPPAMGNWRGLQWLDLSGNGLTGALPAEMAFLTNLFFLDLYNNGLSGSLPTYLGSLTNLETLDLGGNRFTGSIPSELGNLTGLKNFGLCGNGLTGAIPATLGKLTNLNLLFLCYNGLSGPIPPELGALTALQSLRLDVNELSGPQAAVPTAAPDLIVSRVILSPTNPAAGTTGDIIMVIKNQGDLTTTTGFHTYLYVDPATTVPTTPTTSEFLFEVPLAPGAVYTWTRTDHPFTQANPQLYVWVDPPWENGVAESNEQNNRFPPVATPLITAVEPAQATAGAQVTVTVTATNSHFLTAATTADFGPAITVQALTVTSPTQLSVKLQIGANATAGPRPITVTTTYTGGPEIIRRSNAFTVERTSGKDATLTVVPSSSTLLVNRVRTLDIVVTPGQTAVNGVQLHGKVDPAYLELTNVISRTTGLAQVMEAPRFDPATGEFQYAVGGLNRTVSEPFVVLSLVVKAKGVTPAAGAAIAFLKSFPATDITGPNGSILQTATDGVVHVTENATGATILGQVDLQGRPPKPHKAWSIPLTLSLTDLENSEQPAIRKRVTTDEQGRFTLSGLPIGRYTLRVKGDHTLGSAIRLVELQPGDNRLYLGTLLEGDVEHDRSDNRVATIDFGILSGALNQCAGAVDYVPNADLDETDDCVTARDAALLVANFNAEGDRVYASPDKVPAPIGAGAQPQARLTFAQSPLPTNKPLTMSVDLHSVLPLPLYVDPGEGDPVLAVTGYYTFDTNSLEVLAIDLSHNPSTLLLQSAVDNHTGTLRFLVILAPDQPIANTRPLATLKVRLKAATVGSPLTPVASGSDGVDLAGANGSVLLRAESITLVSTGQPPIGATKNSSYLPIIRK